MRSTSALRVEVSDDGGAVVIGADGEFVAGAVKPWAYDAVGSAVPMRLEARGSELVQIIDHRGGGFTYPITADPWLGINLFDYGTVSTSNGQAKVNLLPSAWGMSMWASVSGHLIMNTAGWDEARARWSKVRAALDSKRTMRQQYECHVAGAPLTGGWWNLEKWRPTRTVHWSYGMLIHECNWTTATRY